MSDSLSLMALDFMRRSGGCATAALMSMRLGVSKTQAGHVLRALARGGLACAAVADSNFKIYCLRDAEVEDAFAAVPCFQHLREAFAEIAEGHRGRTAVVKAYDLAAVMARRCGVLSPNALIFPVRAYLDVAISQYAVSVSRGGKYVLPVEVLRRFSLEPPRVPAKCTKVLTVWRRRPRTRMAVTTIKLPMETLEALNEIAAARGTARSAVIREALAEYVSRYGAAQEAGREADEDFTVIQGRT